MSVFQRLISYIYEYEGKTKGKNTGFVKLETRNDRCRLQVSAKGLSIGDEPVGVYLMGKDGGETFLGNMFAGNGKGEFRTIVNASDVEGSGKRIDAYYGLTIHDVRSSWKSYTTRWEDVEVEPVDLRALPMREEESVEPEPAMEEREEASAESEPVIEEQEEESAEPEPVMEEREEEPAESVPVKWSDEEEQTWNLPDEGLDALLDEEERFRSVGAMWPELRKIYPKIQPFEYDGCSEILVIRPDDIGRLPRESWIYGNNSFLLHGYYNFRYLILARLCEPEGKERYLLGVPGHYYSSEKYMASMFGFPGFILSKKQPPNDGRFGYWYTDLP